MSSSREWESIIQQALQSVMEESNEHLPQLLNAFQRDISGVRINTPVQNTAEETDENENTETYTQPVQTSFRNVCNAFRNNPSGRSPLIWCELLISMLLTSLLLL